jgi:hypothetical protein
VVPTAAVGSPHLRKTFFGMFWGEVTKGFLNLNVDTTSSSPNR